MKPTLFTMQEVRPRGEPDVQGLFGKAWLAKRDTNGPADWAATLRSYQVNGIGFHPMWEWWLVVVVHLRAIDGVPPAVKSYPEAEYEFQIVSLDPAAPVPSPDELAAGHRYRFLTPPDCVHQFHGVNDAQAADLVDLAVNAIVTRGVSPDSENRGFWKLIIANTVEHMVLGAHPKVGA